MSRVPDGPSEEIHQQFQHHNPLQLRTVLLYVGNRGVYGLATIMGITDVDPFILGMTRASSSAKALSVGTAAIVIAAASNNLVKGVYAYPFADHRTGVRSLISLAGLALLGLLPLVRSLQMP